jgi:hypothetical protein
MIIGSSLRNCLFAIDQNLRLWCRPILACGTVRLELEYFLRLDSLIMGPTWTESLDS